MRINKKYFHSECAMFLTVLLHGQIFNLQDIIDENINTFCPYLGVEGS